ncbi:MAG: hypothetical protein HYX63_01565 [Gammaproteobacteria bacterium]|nr:hypothetical protein [Gammaproteobacteria bacterium]
MPEKFWDPEKKTLRVDERGLPAGLIKGHSELEKRFGAVPGKPEDFKIELEKDENLGLDETKTATFAKQSHEWGLTNKQFNSIVRAYVKDVNELRTGDMQMKADAALASLSKYYGSDTARGTAIQHALRAINSVGDDDEKAAIASFGNNPYVIRILAKLGAQMKEDSAPNDAQIAADSDIETLMKDRKSAYWNPKAAGHEAAVAKVTRYHEARASQKAS